MRSTGKETLPRSSPQAGPRRSRYDFLLDAVDEDVKLLVRGEDFDDKLSVESLRQSLYGWADARGVRIETQKCWRDPETGKPSRWGPDVPFGLYVKVSST